MRFQFFRRLSVFLLAIEILELPEQSSPTLFAPRSLFELPLSQLEYRVATLQVLGGWKLGLEELREILL